MNSGDRGAVTAEFAVALPAVVAVIALCVGALGVTGRQVRLEQAVAQAARLAARGEAGSGVREVIARIASTDDVAVRTDGDLVCVSARISLPAPLPSLAAESCALAGDDGGAAGAGG